MPNGIAPKMILSGRFICGSLTYKMGILVINGLMLSGKLEGWKLCRLGLYETLAFRFYDLKEQSKQEHLVYRNETEKLIFDKK